MEIPMLIRQCLYIEMVPWCHFLCHFLHNGYPGRKTCAVHSTHWGPVTHICISKLSIIGSDNGLSPGRCQAIIWPNAGILSNRPLGTNFSEILIEIHTVSFKKMHLEMSSGKWRPFVSASMCTCFLWNLINSWGYSLSVVSHHMTHEPVQWS